MRLHDDRLRGWAERSVLVALVAVPLVIVPWGADIFGLPKLLVAAVATVVGWAALSLGNLRQRWWAPTPLAWAVAAYVAVVAVSTLFSRSRYDSFFGSYERYGGLLPLLVFVAFGGLVATAFRGRPNRLALVPLVLTGTAAVAALYIVLQTLGLDVVDWKEASGAAARYQAGTLGNADFAGGFLGIALPLAVGSAVAATGRRRLVLGAAVAVIAVGVVAARSRGGILAALAGVAVLALVERERFTRRVRVALAGAVAAVVVLGLVLLLVPSTRPDVVERSELFRTKSVEVRGREWAGAWKVFLDAPVLGTGPDTFEFGFPGVRSREDGAELGMQIADKPHNVVLEKLSDTGLLGFAAYLAVLVAAFALARRRLQQASLFVAGLAAYVAQALVSIDVPPLAFLGWALIGAVVAAAAPDQPAAGKAKPRQVPTARLAGAAAAVAVVVGLAGAAQAADLAAGQGRWRTAVARNPVQPFYRYGAAVAAEQRGAEGTDPTARRAAFDEAARRYDEVLDRQPRSVHAVIGRARVETLAARTVDPRRFSDADRWWRRAAAADPRDWEVHNQYGLMLNAWANAARGDRAIRTRAAEALEAALRIKPDHVPALVNLAKVRTALGDIAGAREAATRALRFDPGNAEAKALASA